jgi:uncharacterized membrane protein
MTKTRMSTQKMVLGAVLTALVIILQLMGAFIKLGFFQISLVLIPIVIGAAMCGVATGAWLGFVFGMVVLLNGDAAAFLAIDVLGTIVTVLVKGIACGLAAGLVYKVIEKTNKYVAVVAAAVVCPIVNTGVFLLGCALFFAPTLAMWAEAQGLGGHLVKYVLVFLVGGNFFFELGTNVILSPVVVRLLNIRKNKR